MTDRVLSEWYMNGYSVSKSASMYCNIFESSRYGLLLQTVDGIMQTLYENRMFLSRKDVNNPSHLYDFAARKCAYWLDAHVYQIQRLYDTESFEYNPIENYDSNYTETIESVYGNTQRHTGDNTTTNSSNVKITDTISSHVVGTDNINTDTNYGNHDTATTTAAAPYDSDIIHVKDNTTVNDMAHSDTAVSERNIDNTTSGSNISNKEDNTKSKLTLDTTDTGNGTSKQTINRHNRGNIGVTTSQQMIQSERDVARYSTAVEIATRLADIITLSYWGSV